jgi:signal transduction histidine kinase/ActR/RegA family two-component response regulator
MKGFLRRMPLRQKIALLAVVTMAAAQLLAGAGFLLWGGFVARRALATDLETQARVVIDNVAPALAFADVAAAEETLRGLRSRRGFVRACLYQQSAQLFASVAAQSPCPPAPTPDGINFDGDGVNAASAVMFPERGRIGTLILRSSLAPVADDVRAQAVAIAAVLVLSSIAAIVLTRRFQRLLTTPLLDLATTAQAVSRDRDYTRRVEKTTEDEIGGVAEAFNDMMAQVQSRDAELQRALRLKDEFLATVSHELRTPLNAIVGWVHVFRASNVPPDVASQAAEAIDRNAQRQVRLIEDILDVSRVVTGKLRLEPKSIDLAVIVEAALDVIQPAAAAKKIAMSVDLAKPARMWGDPDRLQQILWNLLSNAVKFTPRGGRVGVSLRDRGDTYRIEVRDTGIGIAKDFLPYIFDAFRQADGSMTRTHGGLGLGLAIARHLTELSGGRIEVQSEGTGTTFVVSFPKPVDDVQPAVDGDAGSTAWQRLDGYRILVVDDDDDTRRVLNALLQAQGAETLTAASVGEGRRILAAIIPDVVITDLAMPEEDGYAMLRDCRSHAVRQLAEVRVLALTAYAGEQARQAVLDAGFDGYLAKPIDPAAVTRAVAASLSLARR